LRGRGRLIKIAPGSRLANRRPKCATVGNSKLL
jgi:hypothetical protein